jgi:hypothetical protein
MRHRLPGPHVRHRLLRRAAVAAATAFGVAAVMVATGSAALASAAVTPLASASSVAAPAPSGTAPSGTGSSRTVLLINGDRLAVTGTPGGPRAGTVLPGRPALAGTLVSLPIGGASYEVPVDALPYLDHGLDPSLFDLSALAGREAGGRLPVQLAYAGPRPALPGVTITRSGGGVAAGYLTAASARTFGAALARQYLADRTRASYGTDGMFGGGVSIGLAGTAAPQARTARTRTAQARTDRPHYVMHTLTVRGTDLAGTPDTGDVVYLINVDNAARYASASAFYHGAAKFSVPAGHYFALADFLDLSGSGQLTAQRVVTRPQFTVTGSATVTMAERAADSQVAMVTPRPAVMQATELTLARKPRAGGLPYVFVFYALAPVTTWIAPAATPVTVGRLQVIADGWLTSPAGTAAPYEYDLAYADPGGAIPAQRYQVRSAGLATVSARYYSAVQAPAYLERVSYFPAQLPDDQVQVNPVQGPPTPFYQSPLIPLAIPAARTEYTSAGPTLTWTNLLYLGARVDGFYPIVQSDNVRGYHIGERVTEDWNGYPLHPGVLADPPGTDGTSVAALNPVPPSASRAGNRLTVILVPFSDNVPGHFGPGFNTLPGSPASGRYELDQNGVKIAGGNADRPEYGGDFVSMATLSPRRATIRLVLATARTGAQFPLSTRTRTVWRWRSSRHGPTVLPAGWECPTTRTCTVQPMLTLRYGVPGLGLAGSAAPGTQVLDISAGHLQLAKAAKITGARVQVSVNGGTTWRDAAVTRLRAGDYRAAFTAPAGRYVTLRVAATDAAGGSVTETITRAYKITAPAAPAAARSPALKAACGSVRPGHERCFALYAPQSAVNAAIAAGLRSRAATPSGWGAKDIESAYKLPVSRNSHQTVAVVDAYRTPGVAAYLNVYRRQYGLSACTTATGCLRVVNQAGKASPLPASGTGTGWPIETTLDVDMVSAACPHCKILLVEADSDSAASLATAEDTAARLGAQVISNSYGEPESGQAQSLAPAYRHPGHTIVVASGDSGFEPTNFPASLATVTAVGGTELARADSRRGWTERVWNADGGAGGSGCSAYVPKPSWQHDRHCAMRTVADVSAVAWNVPIYEKTYGGWLTIGGTSAAAPLIAGIYGLAGNAARITPGYEYRHAGSLFDVTAGGNVITEGGVVISDSCGGDYLCKAKKGYDGPTGLGTPDGTGAF